jgi:hypothetical protein
MLRDEHGMRVFENRVLRRIFGPKRDEVTGEWRKLLNEELLLMVSKSGSRLPHPTSRSWNVFNQKPCA